MPTDHDRRDATHLGDGVYAAHDGYYVWLRVNNADWGVPQPDVALEDHVLHALIDYAKRGGIIK